MEWTIIPIMGAIIIVTGGGIMIYRDHKLKSNGTNTIVTVTKDGVSSERK